MEQNAMLKEVLLQLNTRLANGEILFVSNERDWYNWIQARAFYGSGNLLIYAVVKDFLGVFRGGIAFSDAYVESASYVLYQQATIINVNGELIAVCKNGQWTLSPPGTKLPAEFPRHVQSDQDTNDSANSTGDNCDENNVDKPQGIAANRFCQWFRRIFPNKRLTAG